MIITYEQRGKKETTNLDNSNIAENWQFFQPLLYGYDWSVSKQKKMVNMVFKALIAMTTNIMFVWDWCCVDL